MGNAGGSLQFGPDQDEEEDIVEHLAQAEMFGSPIVDGEEDGGLTSRGGPTAEYVSVHTQAYGTVRQASIPIRVG